VIWLLGDSNRLLLHDGVNYLRAYVVSVGSLVGWSPFAVKGFWVLSNNFMNACVITVTLVW
jgi:hypothetical protein